MQYNASLSPQPPLSPPRSFLEGVWWLYSRIAVFSHQGQDVGRIFFRGVPLHIRCPSRILQISLTHPINFRCLIAEGDKMSLHLSRHSEGSASRHSSMSAGSARSRSRKGPATVHAASLLSLQLWAISELRDVLPPLGERARAARLLFLGLVAALMVSMVLSYPLGAFIRWDSLAERSV